jgi:gliding motility-associated-like protein
MCKRLRRETRKAGDITRFRSEIPAPYTFLSQKLKFYLKFYTLDTPKKNCVFPVKRKQYITSCLSGRNGLFFYLICCFLSLNVHAALPEFTLTVTKTDESCLGNGTLTFAVSGTAPGATVEYRIYQLPDTTNAIAVQTTNFLGGRTAGTYLVIAIQSLGGESNSQQQEITINNVIVPLTYNVNSTNALCGPDGSISVTMTSGVGVFYEIISGPVIRNQQSSSVFNNLPAGQYEVRVIDNCGVGWVTTHTVISDAVQISISQVEFPQLELTDCNSVLVSNTLTPSLNDILTYPIAIEYTVHPPGGGAPIIISNILTSGGADLAEVQTVMPLYYGQTYNFDIKVTDHCGNVFTLQNNLVDVALTVALVGEFAECGQKFLTLHPAFYTFPITVNWITTPAGFDPTAFNPAHPGPFSEQPIGYGDFNNPVPWGEYVVEITDGCGHTAQGQITLEYVPPDPTSEPSPYPGCQSNMSLVTIEIPGYTIVTAIIVSAPVAYPNTLPYDVSAFVTEEDGLILDPLITGHYEIYLVDDCGNIFDTFGFDVPDTATLTTSLTRPDCELGTGGLRIRGSSTVLTTAIMNAAPAGFPQTMPYDVSTYITTGTNNTTPGILSMAGLLPGVYSFDVTDSCGITHNLNVTVPGYSITASDFIITPHCGSFDFTFNHISNASASFYLQKWNSVTGNWEHPVTGADYIEGSAPSPTTGLAITANTTTLNLTFTGQFRIVKYFQSFDNGNVGELRDCTEIIDEFEYTGSFAITGFEKITCNGTSASIRVLTNGVAPFHYEIIAKNGQPFYIDNGSNDIFTNLEQAVYTFRVQHSCGHYAVGDADVAQLPSLATANQPDDMETCDDISNNGQETFLLTTQNAQIIGSQNASDYMLTYHASQADAAIGINPLPDNFTSGNTTVYVRLKYLPSTDECFDVTSFDLIVNPYPVPNMSQSWGLCQGGSVTVTAPGGFDSYVWSSGQQNVLSAVFSQSGQYTLTVTEGDCTGVFPFEVVASNPATIHDIEISDWTAEDNSITVVLDSSSIGNYFYSIDGEHYQASNVFNNLSTGSYTVYVKDDNGCGIVHENVWLLSYPRFFTPNGDGHNDFWRIKFSEVEPHLMTYVFDRYGKLITGFLPGSAGWDGTYNGEPLPSTDYWFLVKREDGKLYRGHFAMKR